MKAWYDEALSATWENPADLKRHYGSASILKNNRVVFNIGGNRFRLVVSIVYEKEIVFIKFIGTHNEYDKVDANTVTWKGN